MNFRKASGELSTVTRDVKDISAVTGNVYEAAAIIAKRANQISSELKEELTAKINEFSSSTDNLEEIFENREQIEISRFYEALPKPNAIAIEEFLSGKVYIRKAEEVQVEKENE